MPPSVRAEVTQIFKGTGTINVLTFEDKPEIVNLRLSPAQIVAHGFPPRETVVCILERSEDGILWDYEIGNEPPWARRR